MADDVRVLFRSAETRAEGTRLAESGQHLPSGDSAEPIEYDDKRAFIYRLVAIALAALFVWVIILALMLP